MGSEPVVETPDSRLVEFLGGASRILVFTVAGISTPSGIQDFRGPQGVWKRRQPVYYQDFMASEKARMESWDQKLEGWEAFKNARPNPVHFAVADLEKAGRIERVVTQNIDGLHARAGTSPARLVELHGTNAEVECQTCGQRSDPAPHFDYFRTHGRSPRCPCGGYLKAATISFGQDLRMEDMDAASRAAERSDLVVSLGSTLSVQPAASFPLLAARRGVPYVIINRGPTDHDHLPLVSLRLEGDVIDLFPPAVKAALEDQAG